MSFDNRRITQPERKLARRDELGVCACDADIEVVVPADFERRGGESEGCDALEHLRRWLQHLAAALCPQPAHERVALLFVWFVPELDVAFDEIGRVHGSTLASRREGDNSL